MSKPSTDSGRGQTPTLTAVTAADALRNPEAALRYGFASQWADALAGRRDARVELASLVGDGVALRDVPIWAIWLSRNAHTFAERDHREFLAAQAAASPLISELRRVRIAIEQAFDEATAARDRRARMPDDLPLETLTATGPAEVHDDPAVVVDRRRRAHRQAVDLVESSAKRSADRAHALAAQADQITADLVTLFDITRTRSDRLREYHSRRAATYLRAYLRLLHRRSPRVHEAGPSQADAAIAAPTWTGRPCPWTNPSAGPVAEEGAP